VQKIGNIYVEQPGINPNLPGITAQFTELSGPTSEPQPTVVPIDAGPSSCTVTQTTRPTASASRVLPRLMSVSAGTITMVGAMSLVLAPQVYSLGDGGTSVRYAVPPGSTGFPPGQPLTITASGATVPAFSLAISVPTAIAVTQPDLNASPLTIVRSMDLPIAWTGGGPVGNVNFSLLQDVGGTTIDVQCSAPSSAGHGVIPASALSYLIPTGQGGAYGPLGAAFGVGSSSVVNLTAYDWRVRAVAEPPDLVVGSATIE
jgi:hypothetical protein